MVKSKALYQNNEVCYFCGSDYLVDSKMRKVVDFHQIRIFLRCLKCKGFSLYPKLEQFEIELLYAPSYIEDVNSHLESSSKTNPIRFVDLFAAIEPLVDRNGISFLDYGCGSTAEVVIGMSNLGILSYGLEIEENTRFVAESKSGCKIFSPKELSELQIKFDVIFLGDVLEHLNNPKETLDEIFNVLSPGGLLIAQGPLEGAATISNFFLSIKSFFTRRTISTFPPYHVSLASRKSIIALFYRSNFRVRKIKISEPMWPAPRFGTLSSFKSISSLIFSITKLFDILISVICNKYGTRFYLEATKLF